MADFPGTAPLLDPAGTILSYGLQTLVGDYICTTRSTPSSGAWPAANRALYIPFIIDAPVTVYQIAVENVVTVNGNHDVGVYSEAGARLVSSGSVAQAGASAIQVMNVTDTLLTPGLYFMAMASSSATATYQRNAPGAVNWTRYLGVQQEDTAMPLPATATFANLATSYLPWMALLLRPEA